MPDVLRLERIFQAGLASNQKDSRRLYPIPKIDPSLVVTAVLKPEFFGDNGNIDLSHILMLLLRVGSDAAPGFDLMYRDYDENTEDQIANGDHKVQIQAVLRLDADVNNLAWPLRHVHRFAPNDLPANWRSQAILAVFDTAPGQCSIQALAPEPSVEAADPLCQALGKLGPDYDWLRRLCHC